MKILVVYKKSQLDIYKEKDSLDSLPLEVLAEFSNAHNANDLTLNMVFESLGVKGLDWEPCYRADLTKRKTEGKLVITVGGDGTVLDASHFISDAILLGVNSDMARSVGFLCAAGQENFVEVLDAVLSGTELPTKLNRIEADIDGKAFAFPALNDLLVCHANPAAVARYSLTFQGKTEEQRSSGIWISTPTGSTAAMAAAGGEKLPITDDRLQFKVRELFSSDLVDSSIDAGLTTDELIVTSKMREGQVYIDGSHYKMPFGIGKKLRISLKGKPLKLILTKEMLERREIF